MKQYDATVLFSGGIDSLACLEWARQEFDGGNVAALYINLGVAYSSHELNTCKTMVIGYGITAEYMEFLELGKREDMHGHVPFRNIFFLEMASLLSNNVVFGMLRGEYSEDKSPAFVRRMQSLFDSQTAKNLYNTGEPITIHTPFASYTKTQVVKWLLDQGYTLNDLKQTIGCLCSRSCGQCMSCFNRAVAFENNDLGTVDDYEIIHPAKWALVNVILGYDKYKQAKSEISLWKKRHWLLDVYRAYDSWYKRGIVEVSPSKILKDAILL